METGENLNELLKIRREKLSKLIDEGNDPFKQTKYNVTHYAKNVEEQFDVMEGAKVSLAGRIMSKRGQGKVGFYDLQDSTGRIQLFLKKDILGEELYDETKTLDIGDILGVKGEVFKTKMGQVSVRVEELILLSKSLQILPEKFHGLKDPDLRYRQRYVDLIMNPAVKDVFVTRSKIMNAIREFLNGRGFLEVETPVLSNLAGGANARPFATHHNALDIPMYLRIALELPLKRLIVGGFDKVYELSRVFRNEGMDPTHNPEFTMLETYEAYADYEDVMKMVEELLYDISLKIKGTDTVIYQEDEISFKPPFKRSRMVDLVKEHTGVDFDLIDDQTEAYSKGIKLGLEIEKHTSIGKIIEEAFDTFVEDKLIQPTFVTHHPVDISPLAKKDYNNPKYTERFELFIRGSEYANAFSELNDPIDQKARFVGQVENKNSGDDEAHPYDHDFINALEVGLPPTGGLGIGVDRLVMLMTDQRSIRDVILFPTMKSLPNDK
ncbi:MAG TPA: lysine--tRNA ligase [Eubacteriaceae bacterium]|nr:lysine--tRNA ligase [Eubacteriaceae bacterium]